MVNCAFPTCTVSRNTMKYDGISLFKNEKVNTIPTWRKHLLDVLSKYREMSMFTKEVMENANENSSYVKCIMLKMIMNTQRLASRPLVYKPSQQ